MTALWVTSAILVPWAMGTALVVLLRDGRSPKAFSLSVGAGWLAGQALMLALLYVVLVTSGAGHGRLVLAILAIVAVVLWALVLRRVRTRRHEVGRVSDGKDSRIQGFKDSRIHIASPGAGPFARPARGWLVCCTLAVSVSLLFKLCLLVGAHASIPSRSDDAISIWLFKAKVVAGLDRLPLDEADDYYMGGSNPHYPVFASLVAAWIPLVTGTWSEYHATLPWLFFWINLILLIAGGLQRWLAPLCGWLAAYLVASLPLLAVHAYRPGYADLLLAAFVAGTVLYGLAWRSTNQARHLVLAGLFAAATACMKREGPPIAAIAVLSVALTSWRHVLDWPVRLRFGVLVTAGVVVACVLAVIDFTEQTENARALDYHPLVWAALWRHAFDWSSFHFLFWLAAGALPVVACLRGATHRGPAVLLTVGLCGFIAGVFVLTPQARFALNDQTPSRLLLQVAPAMILALAIPLASVLGEGVDVGAPVGDCRRGEETVDVQV